MRPVTTVPNFVSCSRPRPVESMEYGRSCAYLETRKAAAGRGRNCSRRVLVAGAGNVWVASGEPSALPQPNQRQRAMQRCYLRGPSSSTRDWEKSRKSNGDASRMQGPKTAPLARSRACVMKCWTAEWRKAQLWPWRCRKNEIRRNVYWPSNLSHKAYRAVDATLILSHGFQFSRTGKVTDHIKSPSPLPLSHQGARSIPRALKLPRVSYAAQVSISPPYTPP
ncbi:hypothetical protein F5884DRAFT_263466 [Xylogone sp. PMI_703]|nr:hypothetical protein F5884DRAFT_263466 [Xylogone sp. PMI_703]